jgi:PAS domain S-box-containing protein
VDLDRTDRRWAAITDAASTSETHAIVLADASGQIRYWSPGAERLFGWAAAEAVGQRLDLIVPEEYRERHWAGFNRAIGTGHARLDGAAANIPVRCRDGPVLPFPGRFVLVADAHHAAVGAMAVYESRTGASNHGDRSGPPRPNQFRNVLP